MTASTSEHGVTIHCSVPYMNPNSQEQAAKAQKDAATTTNSAPTTEASSNDNESKDNSSIENIGASSAEQMQAQLQAQLEAAAQATSAASENTTTADPNSNSIDQRTPPQTLDLYLPSFETIFDCHAMCERLLKAQATSTSSSATAAASNSALLPYSGLPPLLVFVHGGIWVDRDKCLYKHLAMHYARRGLAVALINYRLSHRQPVSDTSLLHPHHTIDVANALVFLSDPMNGKRFQYASSRLVLFGHSCGATMLTLNLSTGAIAAVKSSSSSAVASPVKDTKADADAEYEPLLPQPVRDCCAAFIGVCGLYDLELYTRTVPREFWSDLLYVFGDKTPPTEWDTPIRHTYQDTHCAWLLIDSKGDTWVPQLQQVAMQRHLADTHAKPRVECVTLSSGAHNEVIECIGSEDATKDVLQHPVSVFLNRVLLKLASDDAQHKEPSSIDESEYEG